MTTHNEMNPIQRRFARGVGAEVHNELVKCSYCDTTGELNDRGYLPSGWGQFGLINRGQHVELVACPVHLDRLAADMDRHMERVLSADRPAGLVNDEH